MVYFADIAAAKNTATKPSRGDKLGAVDNNQPSKGDATTQHKVYHK
jgi:hypothetical protein